MIPRTLEGRVRAAAAHYPVVTITGPRQSGKTTLCRMVFPDLPLENLERPDRRAFAESDPLGFLAEHPDGAVLDEVQRAPELLSYIQDIVDRDPRPGRFVLSGSQHFGLLGGVAQSLAGRTAVLDLLPLSWEEVRRFPRHPEGLDEALFSGGYPAIHDREVPPGEWLGDYSGTYVERDVRQVLNVGDLTAFQTFLRLAAGRTGQLLNLSALGSDAGVTHNTARSWLSVLETGFLAFRLPPIHRNLRKRLTKSPKVHLLDSGLVCYLLGIRDERDLCSHPLRGAIFESWVASEIRKAFANQGLQPRLGFYRDSRGLEVDVVVEVGARVIAVEVKAGRTVPRDAFATLDAFERVLGGAPDPPDRLEKVVVYGGEDLQRRTHGTVRPWHAIHEHDWTSSGAE